MDVVQFGRWISERRRKYGWSSQRALAETARHDPMLADYKISEDFLARLEAGRLSHPFRGNVRRQVLALAWMLCKTPRDVKLYLNAAELTELSADEAWQLGHLRQYLAMPPAPAVVLLSSRPSRLFGRTQVLHELISTLCTMETGVCAVTGMPGVGKSALAHEVMHMLASHERMHVFPDGIVTFSCTKRHGESGLIALLNEISAVFSRPLAGASRIKRGATSKAISKTTEHVALPDSQELLPASVSSAAKTGISHTADTLADAIDQARMALMDKSVLILLDDLDAHFPLRQALDALLGHSQHTPSDYKEHKPRSLRRVVLTTGRYVPPTPLVTYHTHLGTLALEPALELFASLMRASLSRISAQEHTAMEQICAAVGYLPLAVELAANAVAVKGIPLDLLASQVSENPLDSLLDGDGILRSTFDQALEGFHPEVREQFFLLRTLGVQTFSLECAAAIRSRKPEKRATKLYPLSLLASAASTLGLFASHSLIELVTTPTADHGSARGTRYRFHPLLYAYAQMCMEQIEPEEVYAARRNVQSYAEAYLECFQGDVTKLESEQKFLLAALGQSWYQERLTQVKRFHSQGLALLQQLSDEYVPQKK